MPPQANAAGRESAHVTQGNNLRLAFSPDGRRLVAINGNPNRTVKADRRSLAEGWQPTVDIIDTETERVIRSLDLSDLPHDPDRPVGQGPTFIEVTATEPPKRQRCEHFAISTQGHLLAIAIVENARGKIRYIRMGELKPDTAGRQPRGKLRRKGQARQRRPLNPNRRRTWLQTWCRGSY